MAADIPSLTEHLTTAFVVAVLWSALMTIVLLTAWWESKHIRSVALVVAAVGYAVIAAATALLYHSAWVDYRRRLG